MQVNVPLQGWLNWRNKMTSALIELIRAVIRYDAAKLLPDSRDGRYELECATYELREACAVLAELEGETK